MSKNKYIKKGGHINMKLFGNGILCAGIEIISPVFDTIRSGIDDVKDTYEKVSTKVKEKIEEVGK